MKRHQMRYYPRMREIEVSRYRKTPEPERSFSAPRIDWSWAQASKIFEGTLTATDFEPQPSVANKAYARAWLLPHIALPHALTFAIGSILFLLGWLGWLGFQLGAANTSAFANSSPYVAAFVCTGPLSVRRISLQAIAVKC